MENRENIENVIKNTEERLKVANRRGIECLKRSFGGACIFLFSLLLGGYLYQFAQTTCEGNWIVGFTALGALAGVWKTFKNAMSVSNYKIFIDQLEKQLKAEIEKKKAVVEKKKLLDENVEEKNSEEEMPLNEKNINIESEEIEK